MTIVARLGAGALALSLATAALLLERIDKIGTENKSTTLKSLFARLGVSPRKTEAAAGGPTSPPVPSTASEDKRNRRA